MPLLDTPPTVGARRRLTVLSILVLFAVLVSGCGGDGDDSSAEPTSTTGGDPKVVTIEHRFGQTEVPVDPERIVSLDTQWTDALIAMDAPRVAYIKDPNVEGGSFPWRGDGLADVTGMAATDALPYEQIAAQRPDLIVVTYLAVDKADYDRLAAIAPTIATLTDKQVDTWQDITEAAGKVLGHPDRAEAVVADTNAEVQKVADELPGLEGKTFALVNYVPSDAFHIVSDPEDGAVVLFDQLGMEISPTILDAGDGTTGRVEVSLEQAELLDADLLLLLTNGADPSTISGYEDLPAVKSGAVKVLDYVLATGLNTPTPLSIPYSLEEIRPALEKAAA